MDKIERAHIKQNIAKNIKDCRKSRGMTQVELSRRTNIARTNISRIESGKHTPSIETLFVLAKAMHTQAQYLLDVVYDG